MCLASSASIFHPRTTPRANTESHSRSRCAKTRCKRAFAVAHASVCHCNIPQAQRSARHRVRRPMRWHVFLTAWNLALALDARSTAIAHARTMRRVNASARHVRVLPAFERYRMRCLSLARARQALTMRLHRRLVRCARRPRTAALAGRSSVRRQRHRARHMRKATRWRHAARA